MQRRVVFEISIHAPRKGGDDKFPRSQLGLAVISIHAPREGGDRKIEAEFDTKVDFNPRPPRGGRLPAAMYSVRSDVFQSTPPARGATAWWPGICPTS